MIPHEWIIQWPAILQAITAVLWTSLLIIGCHGFGRWLLCLTGIGVTRRSHEVLFLTVIETSLGIGVMSQLFFWAGLGGIFTFLLVTGLGTCGWILGRRCRIQVQKDDSSSPWKGWFWIMGLVLVGPFILCFVPELGFDAHRVHLWMTKILALTGKMPVDYSNWFGFIPNTAVIWFSASFMVVGEMGAKLAHFSLGLLSALLLVGCWKMVIQKKGGVPTAVFFLMLPVVAWEMSSIYVDMSITLFSLACLVCLYQWRETDNDGWLVVSAVFFGLALASKYNAVFWGPFLLIYIFFFGRTLKRPTKTLVLKVLGYMIIALLVLFPWLAHNYVHTGNPFFPLPVPGLDSPFITPDLIEAIRREQSTFGLGKNLESLLLLPLNMAWTPEVFRGSMGVLVFISLPLVFFFRRSFNRIDEFFGWSCLFWLGMWFLSAQEIRYLAPALPFAAWLSVRPLFAVGRPMESRLFKIVWTMLLAVQMIVHIPQIYHELYPKVSFVVRFSTEKLLVASGLIHREKYIEKHIPYYPVYRWANQNLQPPVRILCFYPGVYWSRWPTLYGMSVEAEFTGDEHDPERVLWHSRLAGLTHVVVNMALIRPDMDISKVPKFFDVEFQRKYLKLVHKKGEVKLFSIPTSGPGHKSALPPGP